MTFVKFVYRLLSILCTTIFLVSIPALVWGIAAGDNAMIAGCVINMLIMSLVSISVWRNS